MFVFNTLKNSTLTQFVMHVFKPSTLLTGHNPITNIVIFQGFNTRESLAGNNISFRKN